MVLFGLLTIHNVRQSHRRVYHTTNIQLVSNANKNPSIKKHKRKKIDRQLLITMLFFQVTLLTILSLPLIIQRFYSTLTLNNSKTALRKAIESFTFSLVLLLTSMALGLPFYIYTLSGIRVFPKSLFKVLQSFRGVPLHE
jgi:Na+/proline symporter